MPRYWEDPEKDDDDDEGTGTRNIAQSVASENGGSGIMQPPPLDPLHNLEIVIGGTYTVGRLVSVPDRRFKSRRSGVASLMDYENRGDVVDVGDSAPTYFKYEFGGEEALHKGVTLPATEPAAVTEDGSDDEVDVVDEEMDEMLAKAEEEAAKAAKEAEAAAAEAKRKEEKMKMRK